MVDSDLSTGFHIERVTRKDMEKIWSLCTEIAQSMAYPSFFCSGDWLKTVSENLCPKDTLMVLAVHIGSSVKALLPLVGKRNMLGGLDLHFLGTDFYPDPLGLICASVDRSACAIALQEYLRTMSGWDRLVMNWVLEGELTAWNLPGKCVSIEPYKVLPDNFSSLLSSFNKKKRYNLRAMVRKVQDAGGELVISTERATHAAFLEALFVLHQKRAVERSIESSLEGGRVEAFHRRLIQESDRVRFYGLHLENRFIAVVYGFEFGSRYFYYQVAHDPDYKELSPGSSLLFLVMEDCCSRGVTEFNFLQGNESYKKTWTKESRELYRCVLNSGTWRSCFLAGYEQANMALKGTLKWAGGWSGN